MPRRSAASKFSQAVEDHYFFNVAAVVAWQAREFRGQPAQVAHHASQNVTASRLRQFRKGQAQIEFRRSSKRGANEEQTIGNEHADSSSHAPGYRPQQFKQEPTGGILEALAHEAPLCGTQRPIRQQ